MNPSAKPCPASRSTSLLCCCCSLSRTVRLEGHQSVVMRTQSVSWEARAAAKRASTLDKIRLEWRLSTVDLERAAKQRDLTGPSIQQFLDAEEISIISMNSVPTANALKEGRLTAVQVTTVFCKTAAIAHQIVSSGSKLHTSQVSLIPSPLARLPHFSRHCHLTA